MWGVLNLLCRLFMAFADIVLWPEETVNKELLLQREARRRGKTHSISDLLHRAFIVLLIAVLCALLLWSCTKTQSG